MDDSPRHSRESSRSLLHGHERSSSIDSLQQQQLNGTGKAYPSSLGRIEEDLAPSEDEEGDAEDEGRLLKSTKIQRDKQKYYDDHTDELPGRPRRNSKFGKAAATAKDKLHDNRGLLMIILSQACFAGMNVMVSRRSSGCQRRLTEH